MNVEHFIGPNKDREHIHTYLFQEEKKIEIQSEKNICIYSECAIH